jgi:hypothetical protein
LLKPEPIFTSELGMKYKSYWKHPDHDVSQELEYPPLRYNDNSLFNKQLGILPIIASKKTEIDSQFLQVGLKH